MPRTKPPRKARTRSAGAEQKKALIIKADYQGPLHAIYSNFASVTSTPNEMCLDFCLIAPPHKFDAESSTLAAPVILRVVIPPEMARGLIEALQRQAELQQQMRSEATLFIGGAESLDSKERI